MRAVRLLMKVSIAAFFLGLLLTGSAFGQSGNEWIDFNQPYFKIPVARDGIYRLTYADLQAAGFPLSGVNPTRLQLFHRGKEQALYVAGEGDSQFDPADFLEFYGQRNDGTLDTELYSKPEAQPHKYYNLYSDSSAYFLTIGTASGKRMASFSEANSGLPVQAFHLDEKLSVILTDYSAGVDYGEIVNTIFDIGEGWMGRTIYQTQSADFTISNVVQTVATGGKPEVEVVFAGRGLMQHQADLSVNGRFLRSIDFSGYDPFTIHETLEWSDIGADGNVKFTVTVNGVAGQPDRISVAAIKLRYAQKTDAASATEKKFILPANAGNKTYVQIENPSASMRLFDVTDPDAVSRIGTTSSGTLNAVVSSTSTERMLFATSAPITPSLRPVSFRQIVPSQYNYLIITHPLLRKPAGGYSDPVKAYAEYRASTAGGRYDTLVVNIQQLYDQFSYGEPTPVGIFRFLKFMANVKMPKYLLLVGKGMDVFYAYYRNPAAYPVYKDFVPSAGFPASDAAFSAGLGGTTYDPAIPTGRIPALKSDDVAAYLDKVKEMEALPYNDLWRKNILHLSGGIEEGEPQLFQSFLKEFQGVAESYHLGGKVSAIAKYSKEIQHINISDQVNAGVSLVTFFGHSSASTLDFDVGYVTDPVLGYKNKGKYPILLMNGCYAGSFFMDYVLFGQDWVVARDKGAAGFIGHSFYGFVDLLKKYSETFYNVGFGDSTFIYKGIGDIQKETAKRYLATSFDAPVNVTQVQQMILLGDPAVKLFGAPKADLEINDNNVSFESFNGQPITALTDSFAIKLIVRNFGQAKENTIRIEVTRTLNDNSLITYDSLYPSAKYSDTLTFIVRKGREMGFGNNTFRVTLDPDDVLLELNEENNTASKTLFIPSNGTKNLFPSAFAIVHTDQVSLALQSTDLLSDEREFIIELDTAYTFDSQYKKQFKVKGQVLARQPVSLVVADTLAYYWRSKLADPKPGESEEWTTSSFTFIKNGPEGWAQVQFPQYTGNGSEGFFKDATSRRLEFLETVTPVSLKVLGGSNPAPFYTMSVKIGGAEYNLLQQGFYCNNNTINLIAFDRKSTVPYIGVPFKWYNRNGRACGREPWVINSFYPQQMVTGANDDLIQYVDNIHAGDSVLLFSIGDANFLSWPPSAKTKLGELGISVAQIDALTSGEPVVIFGRKGSVAGTAKVFRTSQSPAATQVLEVNQTITGGYAEATMSSGLIGPAQQWVSLKSHTREVGATDLVSFDIVGVKLSGVEQSVLTGVNGNQDLSGVSAAEYPYLKIVYRAGDDINLTAAQLRNWVVSFTPVPEGLLVYRGVREQEVLNEGVVWQGKYGFVNISDKTFSDSLTVAYNIFNQALRTSEQDRLKIKAPAPGDTTSFTVNVSTAQRDGLNDVEVYVNPLILPEQYYDNNILQLTAHLNVQSDRLNPVLDVLVDGRHLVNGDFVSPNPNIVVNVWDEDPFVLKTDTVGVRIFLTYPCALATCAATAIPLNSDAVKWYAATTTTPFRVEFNPKNLADGVYTLQVEGADARGNKSGVAPYVITFTVKNESTVTIMAPYPNPFNYQVYFGVLITGDVLPDGASLQIVSVNGRQLADFGRDDFPDFHSGRNELAWDGTDLQGTPLPSGVYIYTLHLTVNGKSMTQQGKIVLVR
ncbi:C25 family cysteine peptidase [Chryseolinea lacunae]|uniref:Gingipain domain-containing protein n=1 Tax=Chryseolinea lacunae TaxID=2801331 RepID=A0ABS1KU01_9BACT|nr:C25 family cysteine peptidase [Chryseolinea lacunae]MBL0742793.1 hypothetical protein [Chryseolinea lacunae]